MPRTRTAHVGKRLGRLLAAAALGVAIPGLARAQPQPAAPEACSAKIQEFTRTYGVAPREIIDAATERTVQFRTPSESVIVICNKANGGVIATATPYQCGGEVKCRQQPFESAPGAR